MPKKEYSVDELKKIFLNKYDAMEELYQKYNKYARYIDTSKIKKSEMDEWKENDKLIKARYTAIAERIEQYDGKFNADNADIGIDKDKFVNEIHQCDYLKQVIMSAIDQMRPWLVNRRKEINNLRVALHETYNKYITRTIELYADTYLYAIPSEVLDPYLKKWEPTRKAIYQMNEDITGAIDNIKSSQDIQKCKKMIDNLKYATNNVIKFFRQDLEAAKDGKKADVTLVEVEQERKHPMCKTYLRTIENEFVRYTKTYKKALQSVRHKAGDILKTWQSDNMTICQDYENITDAINKMRTEDDFANCTRMIYRWNSKIRKSKESIYQGLKDIEQQAASNAIKSGTKADMMIPVKRNEDEHGIPAGYQSCASTQTTVKSERSMG